MTIPTVPRAEPQVTWRVVSAVAAITVTASLFLSLPSGTSGNASSPAISIRTQDRIARPDPTLPTHTGAIGAGSGVATMDTVPSSLAGLCAGKSDAVGEHGGPSPLSAGVSDALGEHAGPLLRAGSQCSNTR
jgi:hypothetical protein